MKKILSVFFSSDRTYVTLLEPTPKGLGLLFLNSTLSSTDLETTDDKYTKEMARELEKSLKDVKADVEEICVSLPAESVLVTQFPGSRNISSQEIRRLVDLEIRQAYPGFNNSEFAASVYPLEAKLDGTLMMLSVIIPKKAYKTCKQLLRSFKLPVRSVEISQINVYNALLYNYPEEQGKNTVLFGVQKQFIDVSVLKQGKLLYFNLASYSDERQISQVIEKEFKRIQKEFVRTIDSVYFYGYALTKEMLMTAQETLLGTIQSTDRLNAFRMMITELPQRDREYCSRVSHIFPPCVGASVPIYHNKIKIY